MSLMEKLLLAAIALLLLALVYSVNRLRGHGKPKNNAEMERQAGAQQLQAGYGEEEELAAVTAALVCCLEAQYAGSRFIVRSLRELR